MSQINVFFNAIREDPKDDLPRLAMAKLLEERGDPRGELIRIQRTLRRLPEDNPERPVLKRRAKELLRRDAVAWLTEFPRPERCTFGFPSWWTEMRAGRLKVTVSADVFLDADVQALAGTESWDWVELLEIRQATPEQVEGIARSPLLASVVSLTIGMGCQNHKPLGDDVAIALSASPQVGNLRGLNLPNNDIGQTGATALAGSRHLQRAWCASTWRSTRSGARELLRSPRRATCRTCAAWNWRTTPSAGRG